MEYHSILFLVIQFLSRNQEIWFTILRQLNQIEIPNHIMTYHLIDEIESSRGSFFALFLFSFQLLKTFTLSELGPNYYWEKIKLHNVSFVTRWHKKIPTVRSVRRKSASSKKVLYSSVVSIESDNVSFFFCQDVYLLVNVRHYLCSILRGRIIYNFTSAVIVMIMISLKKRLKNKKQYLQFWF